MPSWTDKITSLPKAVKDSFDDLRRELRIRRRARKNLIVQPYLGYGRKDYLYAKGRVLEDKRILSELTDSRIRNLINSYKRFETNEIRFARLQAEYYSHEFELIADKEGYYRIDQEFSEPVQVREAGWQTIDYKLLDVPQEGYLFEKYTKVRASGQALIPQPTAKFGVISDIDDTVLQTHVTSFFKAKMLYASLFKNAYTRLPFRGAAEFYRALQLGGSGQEGNPFFYVSNSPWNIYDLLISFMEVHNLPKGPILLRDIELTPIPEPEGYRGHKHEEVAKIIQTYPHLPFILIGDSGESDADIYLAIAAEFPKQILAIYIRDVQHRKRAERIKTLIEATTDIDMRLVNDSREAATHALQKGWITEEAYAVIP